jgi:hypothetical protein
MEGYCEHDNESFGSIRGKQVQTSEIEEIQLSLTASKDRLLFHDDKPNIAAMYGTNSHV